MRPFIISAMICLPVSAVAQAVPSSVDAVTVSPGEGEFRLGGAASRAARVAPVPSPDIVTERAPRLSLPVSLTREENARTERTLGPATVFVSEGSESGRSAVELGTFLSRGAASAGLSVIYLDEDEDLARSEVFLDFAITEQFSVGVSGIFDAEAGDTDPIRQLGVNAEYATSTGTYIQGGFAGAPDYDPVIGLSVGLRF